MTAACRVVVTAGPTISAGDIHTVVPDAEVVPPISFGDALRYGLEPGDTLLIIDGLFFQHAPVRHKELLTLLDGGIRVVGSSSMGALRAAELHPFGMEGYGWVFESYRDGLLNADDEVGMVHGEPEDGYPVFVDALVNIRQTLRRAVETGLLSARLAADLVETARRMPFTARSWQRVLTVAGIPERRCTAKQLQALRVDVKHADALVALHSIAAEDHRGGVADRPRPPQTIWSQRWQQRWAPTIPVAVTTDSQAQTTAEVRDTDVLALLSLCATDRWAYLPALEQVASWHWRLAHLGPDGDVREHASLAAGQVGAENYQRALEIVAHGYAVAVGLADESGFPEPVRAQWLTPDENETLRDDPVSVSARLLTRTLFVTRALPAIEHFLDLLRADPRLPQWRTAAAQALARRDELACQKPHLNLHRPDPRQLKSLFAKRWRTEVDCIELAQRGLMSEEAFYTAATLFAVAAADDRLPAIEVGALGPAHR
ncbi:TfuA-like protein [Mycobacterium angelicum]|uniref:TfuA-like protein n=1 Tax=Mycobacterium angelicum TaxID=470074 RepID=A0A1W9ZFQ3_MYCAN|nr:TfuA-like protein [Mycobacterium angelicum]MCV7199627.1 TfuA-like protein [Mycobacterium angelicum]ORA13912.1 TfuA-like protein [Mycobacterium angelicum]